jgi:hypothetical protein
MNKLKQLVESINQKAEETLLGEEVAVSPEEFDFLLNNGGFLTQVNKLYNGRYYEHKLKRDIPNEGIYHYKTLTTSFLDVRRR